MQRIRKRPRLDTLVNQQRSVSPVAWGRRIYLGLLAVLGLAIADYAVGDAVLLRADGIVIVDRTIVAATYPAKVRAVRVREGEQVEAGQVLIELDSADMLKDIAELAARNSELAIREAQLRVRRSTIESVLPLARRHAQETNKQARRLDAMTDGGLVPANRIDQALASRLVTAEKLAELSGQSDSMAGELALVAQAHERAVNALAQLEAFYAKGEVRAASAGVVGARVPSPGQVVRFGDELLQINGERAYVLAYLPDIYLFGLKAGDRVTVTAGAGGAIGAIDAILSVADALPAEFQNNFRPRDRSRLVRVSIPADHGFAISQKVRIGGCAAGWCWSN